MQPPDVDTVPLGTIIPRLQTGDLVLFSGATSSGAIIKFFDQAQFSHIGVVSYYNTLSWGLSVLISVHENGSNA